MIDKIEKSLLHQNEPSLKDNDLRCAAVLAPIIRHVDNTYHFLFTKRAEHLKHHPGQISFPGGSLEPQDRNLKDAALRETWEEIGIPPKLIKVLGKLPQQRTVSNYNITPYIGFVEGKYQLKIDENEVAEVFSAPIDFVLDPKNQQRVTEEINGTSYSFYVIQYKHYNIWGATAKILVNLTRRLSS